MKFRMLLPALLAVGAVCVCIPHANAFELLDGMLTVSNDGDGVQKDCCNGKADYAEPCAPARCASKCFVPRPVYCGPCFPLLSEACCRIRVAAENLRSRTQALCDAIKIRLFCPSCYGCCQPACGCDAGYVMPAQKGFEVQKDLEVQK